MDTRHIGPIEALDRYLNHQLLAATHADLPAWWAAKVRAKRLLAQSPNPPALAARILAILRARAQPTTVRAA